MTQQVAKCRCTKHHEDFLSLIMGFVEKADWNCEWIQLDKERPANYTQVKYIRHSAMILKLSLSLVEQAKVTMLLPWFTADWNPALNLMTCTLNLGVTRLSPISGSTAKAQHNSAPSVAVQPLHRNQKYPYYLFSFIDELQFTPTEAFLLHLVSDWSFFLLYSNPEK